MQKNSRQPVTVSTWVRIKSRDVVLRMQCRGAGKRKGKAVVLVGGNERRREMRRREGEVKEQAAGVGVASAPRLQQVHRNTVDHARGK